MDSMVQWSFRGQLISETTTTFFFLLVTPRGLQGLGSPIRDGIRATAMKPWNPNHQATRKLPTRFIHNQKPQEATSLVAGMEKNMPAMQGTWVRSLGGKDPLEEGMPTHSGILAWKIPWTEKPGELQSKGAKKRVKHDWFRPTKPQYT